VLAGVEAALDQSTGEGANEAILPSGWSATFDRCGLRRKGIALSGGSVTLRVGRACPAKGDNSVRSVDDWQPLPGLWLYSCK
jgi:hypothetical protein